MIQQGQALPTHTFSLLSNEGMQALTTDDLFANKKVIVFALPGAFTPTCSNTHLPGYVVNFDNFKALGVDSIICLSVNDAFVMKAWGEQQNAENLVMLADGDASFTKALGLEKDTGAFGGLRSQRYAMVVENGVVSYLAVEAEKQFEVSSAEALLAHLSA